MFARADEFFESTNVCPKSDTDVLSTYYNVLDMNRLVINAFKIAHYSLEKPLLLRFVRFGGISQECG